MKESAYDASEADWVDANQDLVERAFASFMDTGEWPPVEQLQRELDRHGCTTDVREALRHMPRLPGEQRAWEPANAVIPLRLLRLVPTAKPVIELCTAIARRAVEVYESDANPPTVTSDDMMSRLPLPYDEALMLNVGVAQLDHKEVERLRSRVQRAGQLLAGSPASPLGSGSYGNDVWRFEVDGRMARRYRDMETPGGYFKRQAEILAEYASHVPGAQAPKPVPREVFVLMPFGPDWSPTVYGMVRRATASLASADLEIDCYRADDIVAPGKITDQITGAIETADAIVADITGTNPNVMWELGYAQALDKPVVILNQDITDSPFDLRDWRQVPYDLATLDTDEHRVADHLREALGLPPTKPVRDEGPTGS